MNKCLKISFSAADLPDDFLRVFIQKQAKSFDIEGVAQIVFTDGRVKIVACGPKEDVDAFVDALHKGSTKTYLDDIEIEPFLKDKDYRGVFRVLT